MSFLDTISVQGIPIFHLLQSLYWQKCEMIKGAPTNIVLRLCIHNLIVSKVADFSLLLHRLIKERRSHSKTTLS